MSFTQILPVQNFAKEVGHVLCQCSWSFPRILCLPKSYRYIMHFSPIAAAVIDLLLLQLLDPLSICLFSLFLILGHCFFAFLILPRAQTIDEFVEFHIFWQTFVEGMDLRGANSISLDFCFMNHDKSCEGKRP